MDAILQDHNLSMLMLLGVLLYDIDFTYVGTEGIDFCRATLSKAHITSEQLQGVGNAKSERKHKPHLRKY